jgi:hypothetical protein
MLDKTCPGLDPGESISSGLDFRWSLSRTLITASGGIAPKAPMRDWDDRRGEWFFSMPSTVYRLLIFSIQ